MPSMTFKFFQRFASLFSCTYEMNDVDHRILGVIVIVTFLYVVLGCIFLCKFVLPQHILFSPSSNFRLHHMDMMIPWIILVYSIMLGMYIAWFARKRHRLLILFSYFTRSQVEGLSWRHVAA